MFTYDHRQGGTSRHRRALAAALIALALPLLATAPAHAAPDDPVAMPDAAFHGTLAFTVVERIDDPTDPDGAVTASDATRGPLPTVGAATPLWIAVAAMTVVLAGLAMFAAARRLG